MLLALTAAPEHALRADARRNHERIVASARELFARDGVDASVEEITRRAGVGMGTLYRHFPTKGELVDAVLADAFEELVETAERALRAESAWDGFASFLEQALASHAANRGLKDVLASGAAGESRAEAMRTRMRPLVRRLIERAQAEGTLRADFTSADLPLVFWSSGRVIELTEPVAPDHWRRFLALLLDGLRAPAAAPLPGRPLTRDQVARATERRPS
jgi:AcrR family transcriptional regulator